MKQKLAIYPGSFNPFTIGHLNILEKAEAVFGKENVIILVGNNPDKAIGEVDRVKTIQGNLPSKNVESFSGFLTDFIFEKEQLGFEVFVIKGLRNGDDLSYEVNQLRYLDDRIKNVKPVFFICDKEFAHVSSSGYRACEKIQPGSGHIYLAKETALFPNEWCVFIDFQSLNSYAMMEMISKNEDYLFRRSKVFSGTKEECEQWIETNPYRDFNKEEYEIGALVSYDREHCILTDISETECFLTFGSSENGGGCFVQRYKSPWIWKQCKK